MGSSCGDLYGLESTKSFTRFSMWSTTEAKNLKTMPQKMPITKMENW